MKSQLLTRLIVSLPASDPKDMPIYELPSEGTIALTESESDIGLLFRKEDHFYSFILEHDHDGCNWRDWYDDNLIADMQDAVERDLVEWVCLTAIKYRYCESCAMMKKVDIATVSGIERWQRDTSDATAFDISISDEARELVDELNYVVGGVNPQQVNPVSKDGQ